MTKDQSKEISNSDMNHIKDMKIKTIPIKYRFLHHVKPLTGYI